MNDAHRTALIAIDWGTTSARAYRISAAGAVLATRHAPLGIRNVVCKINDPVRAQAYAHLGVNTVDRTMMMIDSIGRFMGRPGMPGGTDVTRATSRPASVGDAGQRPDDLVVDRTGGR